ncbi:hypothetical protein [uncultured Sphingomonas sp.]|uniref:hypothetical protein n=1 Tax=uncultured Sphingomonas sp. TaxID=158754 RepID=UPI003749053F
MTDVKVEQCDRVAAHAVVLCNLIAASGSELPWMREALADILEGKEDGHYMVQAFARHRQAAEKAQHEAVEEAYEEELRAANEHFREGIISYDVLKAAVNTAARMRDAAIRSQGHE